MKLKTCTACGKTQKIKEFRENCGEYGMIENLMCHTCIEKAEKKSREEDTTRLLQKIAERVF